MCFVHEYTWVQDCEYRIRTEHAQCTCYTLGRSAPGCTQDCLSSPKYICDQVGQAYANQLLANILASNTAWRPNEVRQLFSRTI